MPAQKLRIFLSSVQSEFLQVRKDLKDFLLGDAVLHRFISKVFLFEDMPAADRRADDLYLDEAQHCDIYIGIFGNEYGSLDAEGVSPTEREFDCATHYHKTRLVYIWGRDDSQRSKKMLQLIHKASEVVIRRRVENMQSLISEVYDSLVEYLDQHGALQVQPFDISGCLGSSMHDISRKIVDWFLETARRERRFPIAKSTTTKNLLIHLNLINTTSPANAAILLFSTNPQKFIKSAEIKCMRCHGVEYRRPFASQQIYGGNLFEQVDQARDFILGKIDRAVGVREDESITHVVYELPPDAITEAVVNAVAHRDYTSNASVEIRLFSDRLEIWNPGSLPGTLTLDSLYEDHPSVPFNPLIADVMYLAHYIEKAGSGTQRIIEVCRGSGLPDPDFEIRHGSFVVTLWKDWLTEEVIQKLELNERQKLVIQELKRQSSITNSQYQLLVHTTRATSKRDLEDFVAKGILAPSGKGRGAYYQFSKKRLINGSNGSSRGEE